MYSHAQSRFRRAIAGATSALLLAAGLTVVTEAVAPTAASAAQDPTQCQNTVALSNGTFESPAIPNATYRLLDENIVPGWFTDDSANQIEIWSSGFQGVTAAQGRQFAELNANSASMLYQDVATTPGQTLAWSLKHRARQGTDVMRVMIGVPGGTLTQNGPNLSDTTAAWGSHSGTYTVPAGQTVTRFGFQAVSAGSGSNSVGNFLDDITFGTGPCLITTKSVTNLTRSGTTAEVGDVLRYTVTTRNDGGNPATQSVSTDQLAAGLEYVPGSIKIVSGGGAGALTDASGDDRGEYTSATRSVRVRLGDNGTATAGGSIGVGASTSYSFDAKVAVSAANTTILNEATVAFRDGVVNQNRTSTSNETQTPVNAAADLAITKTLDTSPLVAGRPATFTITVTNNGPQTGTGVSVTDAVPAGLSVTQVTPSQGSCTTGSTVSCAMGSLAVGATATITVTGTVSASMNPGSALTNTASVSGTLTDPNPGNNTASASGTLSAVADLSIDKVFAPASPVAGQNLTYTLTVHNDGPSEARTVRVTDPLDPETTFVSVTSQQGSCAMSGQTLNCDLGTLASGATTTVTVTVQLASGATAVVQNSASVTSSTPDPDPSNNVDSTSFQPSIIADLAVTKTASVAQAAAGGTVTYTLVVTNNGTSDAVNAVLDDTLPTGLTVASVSAGAGAVCATPSSTRIQCTWATLAQGASTTITLQALVAADAPVGTVTNTASVASPAEDSNPANNSDSADVEIVQSADIRVVKTADSQAVPGGPFGYTLTVGNDGPSVARGVVLTDTLPAGFALGAVPAGCVLDGSTITCAVGDLAVGQVVTVRVEGTLQQTAKGTLRNTATVTSPTPDPDPSDNTSTVDKPLTPSADVQVTKTTSTPSVPLNGTATFEITVTNAGPSAAEAVIVREAAPPGLMVTGATPSAGTWSAADAVWTVGTLLPGESETLTVTAKVVSTGSIENTATGTSQTPDPDPSNNTDTATVEGTPSADLSIVKTASANPVPSNGPLTYTIVVTNNGPSPAAAVTVSDPLPSALRNPTTPTGSCSITAGQLNCAAGTLAVGATFTATVSGTVDPATTDTSIVNTATTTSTTPDPDTSNNTSTVTTPIAGTPRVELVKTASAPVDANANGRIDAGDRVDYTFTVRNTGDVTLTAATITDPLLGGAVACAAFAPLAPGAEVACAPVAYTLTQADIDRGTVRNTASVEATSSRGTATDDAEANVIVPAANSISLTKTAGTVDDANGNGVPDAGEEISYTFSVRNTGTTTLRNATITDPMLGGAVACTALDGVALAPGQTVTCAPITYTLTQGDIDAGVVRNTATVVADAPVGTVTDTASASADIDQTAGIDLVKEAGVVEDTNSDGRIGAGDTIRYSFVLTNTGTTTLVNVTVTDPLLGTGALCTVSSLLPGATADCGPYPYQLTQADIENQSRSNTARATGTSPLGPVTDDGSTVVTLVGTPAVQLTKTPGAIVDTDDDGMVGAGDTVGYTFTVRNTGTTVLTDLVLNDPLLGGDLDCPDLDGLELAPGDEATCGPVPYELTQADIDAGTVHNVATVEGQSVAGPADDEAEADVEVTGTDALTLLKSAGAIVDANGNGRTDAGDTIEYTFTVTNTGTTTLTDVSVSDPRLTGAIVCETTELAPGEATLCHGEPAVLTQAEIDAGEIVNTATATGTGTGEPPTAETTVVTPIEAQPAIALAKTGGEYADTDANGRINPGDTVKFRFTVTNTGARTLAGVVITDPMLGGEIACEIPDLAPGATADCGPVVYTLTAADIAKGKVVNVATVSGTAGAITVTAAATATVDLDVLATTGGIVTGIGWALALLAIGALVLLVARVRRREERV
ncbi:CARDB domain-containing protein [Streptomyces sp. AC495_CC817]|uniref:DUF7507 domain-containing protein n=1 Tax=Streptomyces sp. AC495_CC817 TaxID=2823900 RepID=UPI001C27015F|nr:CARDB domain-containing protein [Streptomyces sp. AC495_CC817]